jgi:hypothetical protein
VDVARVCSGGNVVRRRAAGLLQRPRRFFGWGRGIRGADLHCSADRHRSAATHRSADPTFVSEIDLTTFKQADGSNDCINKVIARAPLVWTFGPLRPYLRTLLDSGTRSGAAGEVVIDATGRPVAYKVAANDLLPKVAGRFGITPDDAFYLNPARAGSPESPELFANEVLNLNLRAR